MSFNSHRTKWLNIVLILAISLALIVTVQAQEPVGPEPEERYDVGGVAPVPDMIVQAETAQVAAPTVVKYSYSATPPVLTAEQLATQEYWLEHTGLPGPARGEPDAFALAEAAPMPGTESVAASVPKSGDPKAPYDFQLFKKILFNSSIPGGYKSNVMESSVGQNGKYIFFTGNWFAARSTDFNTFAFVNPYTDMTDFCCDQVTIFDESRNRFFWLRMGIPANDAGGNYENRFRLGVSANEGSTFCNYDFYPMSVNSGWTDQWWDYPHIQLGADYLYITWNMFNEAWNWTRTVIMKLPLDGLAACVGFGYSYWPDTYWFTEVPVQYSPHIMYFASNFPPDSPWNRLRIIKWAENSGSLYGYTKTVATWSWSDFNCGALEGDWGDRGDDRVLTGARYMIHASNLLVPGRKVLGWWWNAAQTTGFPYPYIEGAAFYEDTLAQVSGWQGRPLVWNASTCFLYPSATPNKRGDLAIIFNYSGGTDKKPYVGAAIADDYRTAPPGFLYYGIQGSNARPSDEKWGDYNTLREFEPTQKTWIGGAHYIPGTTNCSNCSAPVFFAFGRGRDQASVTRWWNK